MHGPNFVSYVTAAVRVFIDINREISVMQMQIHFAMK